MDAWDAYAWRWAGYHCVKAGRPADLRAFLLNLEYLSAKLRRTSAAVLLADFTLLPDDPDLQRVEAALRLSSHVLEKDPDQLAGQLLGRLPEDPDAAYDSLRKQAASWIESSAFLPLAPRLLLAGGPLLRMLDFRISADIPPALAITNNQEWNILASDGDMLKLWSSALVNGPINLCGISGASYHAALSENGRWGILWSQGDTDDDPKKTANDRSEEEVAATSKVKNLQVWDTKTGRCVKEVVHKPWVIALAISGDGNRASAASLDGHLYLWSFPNDEPAKVPLGGSITSLAISADGKWVVSGGKDGHVRVCDADRVCIDHNLDSRYDVVKAVAVSSHDRAIAAACSNDRLQLWDLTAGPLRNAFASESSAISSLAMTPDATWAVAGSDDQNVQLWETGLYQRRHRVFTHGRPVRAVAISENGKWAISASPHGHFRFWSLQSDPRAVVNAAHSASVNTLGVTPDGTALVSASEDGTLALWELDTHEFRVIAKDQSSFRALCLICDKNQTLCASSGKQLTLWNFNEGKLDYTFEESPSEINALVLPPGRQHFVSASEDGVLRIQGLEDDGYAFELGSHDSGVEGLAMSRDGGLLVSAARDNSLGLWNLTDNTLVATFDGHDDWATAVAISSDGKLIVSGSADHTVRAWDLTHRHCLNVFEGHRAEVRSVAISPNGRWAVSASIDCTLRMWDIDAKRAIARYDGDYAFTICAITPDGQTVIAGDQGGNVHFLKAVGVPGSLPPQRFNSGSPANTAKARRPLRRTRVGAGVQSRHPAESDDTSAPTPQPMKTVTDPTGKTFVSYRRSRAAEVKLLITALHLHGVPTWQDTSDLESGPTEDQIRETLADPAIASAILWVTPDVVDSSVIRRIEAPLIVSRYESRDSFFPFIVAAGGLDFASAKTALGPQFGIHDPSVWNQERAVGDPINYDAAANLASKVLSLRLRKINQRLPADAPLRLRLSTRDPERYSPGAALVLNWHSHFSKREAPADVWTRQIYPALRNVGDAICLEAPGRRLEASGKLSLVASVALGVVFLAPRDIHISWQQALSGRPDQLWSLDAPRTPSRLKVNLVYRDTAASDLAVLVAIARTADELREDFGVSQHSLPSFRAVLELGNEDGSRYDLSNAGEAVEVAHRIVQEIISARTRLHGIETVHLFLAAPAGLAMMVGQLLNGLPQVQLYEHVPGMSPGPYRPALRLNPSI